MYDAKQKLGGMHIAISLNVLMNEKCGIALSWHSRFTHQAHVDVSFCRKATKQELSDSTFMKMQTGKSTLSVY